jgi:hypothetical protein
VRKVDPAGSVSFAGTSYWVGNRYIGQIVGVRLVADTVQITHDGHLLRTHRARHDKSKEFGALANPTGRPRGSHKMLHSYRSSIPTGQRSRRAGASDIRRRRGYSVRGERLEWSRRFPAGEKRRRGEGLGCPPRVIERTQLALGPGASGKGGPAPQRRREPARSIPSLPGLERAAWASQ